jgi:hypothetical protein
MDHELAITRGLRTSIAAPGGKVIEADLLSPANEGISARTLVTEAVEDSMLDRMQDMRIAHVDRNAEQQEQVGALHLRRDVIADKLATEVQERDQQFASLTKAMQLAFDELDASLTSKITQTFVEADQIFPGMHAHLAGMAKEEDVFYKRTVPATNEAMCGAHIREMEGHREALDLDATTIRARERRMNERIDKHIAEFDLRCLAEAQDRQKQYDGFSKQFAELVGGERPMRMIISQWPHSKCYNCR